MQINTCTHPAEPGTAEYCLLSFGALLCPAARTKWGVPGEKWKYETDGDTGKGSSYL